ncbi:hypothetical protein FRC07_001414 [Ceratobasidium sp. 392]|nr:hypothetical protein FRC07_001414 [Ceratobasidium sp. 392]
MEEATHTGVGTGDKEEADQTHTHQTPIPTHPTYSRSPQSTGTTPALIHLAQHGLLAGTPGDQANPLPTPGTPSVVAYVPSNAGSHASSHAANNAGITTQPTQPTPSTSQTTAAHPSTSVVTKTQDTQTVLAAENQVKNSEDTVDYGEDYELDGTEGQGVAAGLV